MDTGPKYPDNDPRQHPPQVLQTQLAIAVALGASAYISFCVLRRKWPQLYEPRRERRKDIPRLSSSLMGWMWGLHKISEEEVLTNAGLDAYVFLGFFKCTIQLLSLCTVCAVFVISPIRMHYTGNYDQDSNEFGRSGLAIADDDGADGDETYDSYLWMYVFFTYIFTVFAAYFFSKQTMRVLDVRQQYLGRQNSITDRTIRVFGITRDLLQESALKSHIDNLGIGHVRNVTMCRDWEELDVLFEQRKKVVEKLESAWSKYLYGDMLVTMKPSDFSQAEDRIEYQNERRLHQSTEHREPNTERLPCPVRPTERVGWMGLFGAKVDVIEHYTHQLEDLDTRISEVRERMVFEPTGSAFVTMDSVASAQVMAQAVLDPLPYTLTTATAPAPHDVVWRNLYMSHRERLVRTWCITFIIAFLSVAMVIPVSYLASFLRLSTIKKFVPPLAGWLEDREWALTLVTGILPPFVFTLFNFIIPYFYMYLSKLQGSVSYGDIELSVISKNFFYIFFNMFLVFTAAGAASSYWSFLKDTTQIAYELAKALQEFSLFYVDLIILQGIGMFPFRLLQLGHVVQLPVISVQCKTPRQFRAINQPPIFNYGIQLPQPIVIFIIVMLYSVISTKILFFGTIYFIFGYYTYKYQLMYVSVHPQHSTGRAWPIILRRVLLGLGLFHLAMAGILALQQAYLLATLLAPLPLLTVVYWYNFEASIVPLLDVIALQAIETKGSGPSTPEDSNEALSSGSGVDQSAVEAQEWDSLVERRLGPRPRSHSRTLDEEREQFQRYVNPNLVKKLDGPCIGFEGDELIFVTPEGSTVRREVQLEEWE